jgi:hypothetical protein
MLLKNGRLRWIVPAVIVLGALLLRAHDVSRILLWLDETDMFNEYVYGDHPKSLVDFALSTRNATTVTWGWPAIIWIVSRSFGPVIGIARMATVLVSTAGVLLIFLLVYRLLRDTSENRFLPAVFAALFAAVSIVQLEYAQRTYPYGATPCIAAAILLAHFEILRVTSSGWKMSPRLVRAAVLYTAVVAFALCIHASLALLPAVSVTFLFLHAAPDLRKQPRVERKRFVRLATSSGAVLFIVALLNAKQPHFGFRPYLAQYYLPVSLSSLPKLFSHAYGLFTYHLNLFYNPSLYWPDGLNIVLLPLVALCVWGWSLMALGKFGAACRHFAWLGLAVVTVPAILSFARVYPFGGVRQSLFLSPFFLACTALGFYSLRVYKTTLVLGVAAACAYLTLWAVNLPRFYNEREPVYAAEEIVDTWKENGSLPVYARECERELRYELRQHPEIHVDSLPQVVKAPYLVVATHNWIGDNSWYSGYPELLRREGYKATILKQAQARHLDSPPQSLYFPPNGLWIYKVTAQ